MVTFLSFIVTVAWVPGIPGMALTPRWALLSVIVPGSVLVLKRSEKVALGVAWVGAALLAYAALSLLWTTSLPDGVNALWKLTLLAGLVYVGSQLPSLEDVFVGAALGMGITSLFIIIELGGLDILQQKTQLRPGLFFNPNIVTETATLVFVGCLGLRLYWPLLLVAPALLLTHSRGGMAALAVALLWWCWKRSAGLTLALAMLVAAGTSLVYFSDRLTPKHDRFRGGMEFNVNSVKDRLEIWSDAIQGLTWHGAGIGSFRANIVKMPYRYPTIVKGRTDHAHNDFLEMAYELGIVGIVSLLVLLGLCFSRAFTNLDKQESASLVVLAFIIEALVQFPLHMPVTASLAALCVGRLMVNGQSQDKAK